MELCYSGADMRHILTEVCTLKKHENLHKGGFGYADFKNRGKHDGIPTVPAQNWKLKMAATKTHFPRKIGSKYSD